MEDTWNSIQAQPWYLKLEHALVASFAIYFTKRFLFGGPGFKANVTRALINTVKLLPGGAAMIESEQRKIIQKIEHFVRGDDTDTNKFVSIPSIGKSREDIINIMKEWRGKEKDYNTGKAFGGIYNDDHENEELIKEVVSMYMDSNALYPSVFPGLRKFEAEVIAMIGNMLEGDENVVGTMTSGGTESICMAMLAYRERAREIYNIEEPEMIVPSSAHAAFYKAAHYFGIKLVLIPIPEDQCVVDPARIKSHLNRNTIVVVASAPNFPNGHIDPIEKIAAVLKESKSKAGLHVDACLGGFLLPWLKKAGLLKKNFDFSIPEVTSISVDIHKYGYGPKGTSVVMYRGSDLRKHQYYTCVDWSGGLYCSPSFQGSRAGGPIAGAWATLVHLGQNGYANCAKSIYENYTNLINNINNIKGLKVLGNPDACCISFHSDTLDIYKIADAMGNKGWNSIARLHKPVCLMIQVGMRRDFDVDGFLTSLKESVEEVRANPDQFKNGLAPIYGMAASLPDRGQVSDLLEGYMDVLLKP